jgi:hypothetical protein
VGTRASTSNRSTCAGSHPRNAGGHHAGEGNVRAGGPGQAPGQGADDAGRRVRARGDGACSAGQTRRALDQAGDRHRLVEGSSCWGETSAPSAWLKSQDQTKCRVRQPCRQTAPTAIGHAIARHQAGAQARRSPRRLTKVAGTSGPRRRAPAIGSVPKRGS